MSSCATPIILPRDVSAVHEWLERALKLLNQFAWLTDSYVLDFFVEDHWSRLPVDWRDALHSWSPDTLSQFLAPAFATETWPSPPPLSLLSFRASCHCLSFPRATHLSSLAPLLSPMGCSPAHDCLPSSLSQLPHQLQRHVTPKKRHEIVRLAALVAELARSGRGRTRQVIDLGAGQGHLARCLACVHSVPVLAVDAQSALSTGAQRWDSQLRSKLSPHCPAPPLPRHVTLTLGHQSLWPALLSAGECVPVEGCVLVGLHACGRLSQWLLQQLVTAASHTECCSWLALVSCCYMKLATAGAPSAAAAAATRAVSMELGSSGDKCGWLKPMSDALQQKAARVGYRATFAALELSCHALENYIRRLRAPDQWRKLRVHAYRAALERVLVRRAPGSRHSRVATVRHVQRLSFAEYARLALTTSNPVSQPIDNLQSTHQPISEQQSTDRPIGEQQSADQPISELQSADRPISKQQSTDQPISEQQSADQPISMQQTISQPFSEHHTSLQPVIESVTSEQQIIRIKSVSTPSLNASSSPGHSRTLVPASAEESATEPAASPHEHSGLVSSNSQPMTESDCAPRPISKWHAVCGPISDDELETANRDVQQWRHVVAFFSLRLLLAPVVESIVLADRLLFLHERGLPCGAAPLFDPSVSPRNFVIVARQPSAIEAEIKAKD